jgi:hypothetical protein
MYGGWNVLQFLNRLYSLPSHWLKTDGKNKDVERNILCLCLCVCVHICNVRRARACVYVCGITKR